MYKHTECFCPSPISNHEKSKGTKINLILLDISITKCPETDSHYRKQSFKQFVLVFSRSYRILFTDYFHRVVIYSYEGTNIEYLWIFQGKDQRAIEDVKRKP